MTTTSLPMSLQRFTSRHVRRHARWSMPWDTVGRRTSGRRDQSSNNGHDNPLVHTHVVCLASATHPTRVALWWPQGLPPSQRLAQRIAAMPPPPPAGRHATPDRLARGLPKRMAIPGVKHIIAVASGKGGVGTSRTPCPSAVHPMRARVCREIHDRHQPGHCPACPGKTRGAPGCRRLWPVDSENDEPAW